MSSNSKDIMDATEALKALTGMVGALGDLALAAERLSAMQREQQADSDELTDRIKALRESLGELKQSAEPAEPAREVAAEGGPVLTVHTGSGDREHVDVKRMRKLSGMADRLFLDQKVDEEDYAERMLILGHMAREDGFEPESVLASMLLATERYAHMHNLPGLRQWSTIIPQGMAIGDLTPTAEE